jgi:hypothetical protein
MSQTTAAGARTVKPLTPHALSELRRIVRMTGGVPRQEINPGVVNKLVKEKLARIVLAPTPYATRKGTIEWLIATDAGRTAALAKTGGA